MNAPEISEEKEWEDSKRQEEFKKTESMAHRESDAARTLQRTYRGYKSRRELHGFSLDPSTRWTEVEAALIATHFGILSKLIDKTPPHRLSKKRVIAPSRLLALVPAEAFSQRITFLVPHQRPAKIG